MGCPSVLESIVPESVFWASAPIASALKKISIPIFFISQTISFISTHDILIKEKKITYFLLQKLCQQSSFWHSSVNNLPNLIITDKIKGGDTTNIKSSNKKFVCINIFSYLCENFKLADHIIIWYVLKSQGCLNKLNIPDLFIYNILSWHSFKMNYN